MLHLFGQLISIGHGLLLHLGPLRVFLPGGISALAKLKDAVSELLTHVTVTVVSLGVGVDH
jgi:hypothetical protein